MNTIVSLQNTDCKTVFIVIEHIRLIYKLKNCYSVIYGDQEDSFVQIDEDNFYKITSCMKFSA